jgi:hypothetical protein
VEVVLDLGSEAGWGHFKKRSHMLTLTDRHELMMSFMNSYRVIKRALPNLTSGLRSEDLKDFRGTTLLKAAHLFELGTT